MKQPNASRSLNMSRIRSKDTKAEILLRRALWQNGFRFRKNSGKIPGKPDVLIIKYKLAIFVDGSFWHGYNWPAVRSKIKTNAEFWIKKIEGNMERDRVVNRLLSEKGFTVMRFWDHQIFGELSKCLNQVSLYIETCKTGAIPENPH
nr:very short patch repair endonuclease [Pedobacter agri]